MGGEMMSEQAQSPLVKWAEKVGFWRDLMAEGVYMLPSERAAIELHDHAAKLEAEYSESNERNAELREQIDTLEAENAALRAGTWQPVEDGAQYSLPDHTELQIWSDRLRIEGQGQIIDVEWIGPARLCRLVPGAQPDAQAELLAAAELVKRYLIDEDMSVGMADVERVLPAAIERVRGTAKPYQPDAQAELLAAAEAMVEMDKYDLAAMADEPVEYKHLMKMALDGLRAAIARVRGGSDGE